MGLPSCKRYIISQMIYSTEFSISKYKIFGRNTMTDKAGTKSGKENLVTLSYAEMAEKASNSCQLNAICGGFLFGFAVIDTAAWLLTYAQGNPFPSGTIQGNLPIAFSLAAWTCSAGSFFGAMKDLFKSNLYFKLAEQEKISAASASIKGPDDPRKTPPAKNGLRHTEP
jgi:hypothetical protein